MPTSRSVPITKRSQPSSAFLKANTKEHILKIGAPPTLQKRLHAEGIIKVKLEVDTDPSRGFVTDTRNLLYPIPFSVGTLSLPSLFAGKMHAVLCRQWRTRIKGRDWYDMLWFISRRIPVRLQYLEEKMRQTGHYTEASPLNADKLSQICQEKIANLDVEKAKEDVIAFIEDPRSLDGWTRETFYAAIEQLLVE